MLGENSVFKLLQLYISSDKFYIEPLDADVSSSKILEIDRVTQEFLLTDNRGQIPRNSEVQEICGILGIIHLMAGPYLLTIKKRRLVGIFNGHEIWQVKETDIVPFPKTMLHLTEEQNRDNKIFVQMVKTILQNDGFYFSYTYDLTHTLQRLQNTASDFVYSPLFERADPRFIWNHHLIKLMSVQPELCRFVLPVIQGFISIKKCSIKQHSFDLALISRRSCYRAGTRYYMRGVDSEGEVANYVETEQVMCFQGELSSYVQTRGSIPLYWSQRPCLKYKPTPKLAAHLDHKKAFQLHLDNQIVYYGSQVLINLIDTKGSEKVLGDQFGASVNAFGYPESQLRYVAFDFHKECSKMRWHRLSILMERIAEDIINFGYFKVDNQGEMLQTQLGVFRTNCIDCLDRTNVVQSMIARKVLERQLRDSKILEAGESPGSDSLLEFIFKNMWADNADACSTQYSGTGALKTDFTRFGKRTRWGLMQDGINSAIRYYKNNFSDGYRQDAIDLFLGNYIVNPGQKPSPFHQQRDWKFLALPVILLIGFSMLIISLLIPSTDFGLQLLYILFWGLSCLVTLYFVVYFGMEYVDRPRLAQKLKEVAA
eukprot:Seg666.6 transcript_id=Seg666.6/GoldUCD/mRNA.D3Y31 product="Phosphatidylinositide phosphatase SAC1-B" protein_id=Seg666.6/GoldUCD/D3Y31